MANTSSKKTSYDLGVDEETTFVVAHPDGEVEFKTDAKGTYTPKNDREVWALKELGATPTRKE